MATKASRIKKEAREAATFRGHQLGKFQDYGRGYYIARCRKCPADVAVNLTPMPNEIDIGGPAVAMNCPWERTSYDA